MVSYSTGGYISTRILQSSLEFYAAVLYFKLKYNAAGNEGNPFLSSDLNADGSATVVVIPFK